MAGNTQISIKDEQTAKQWLATVQGINEDYFEAMKGAADTLNDVQNAADGTLVDELVNFSTDLLNAAQSTFNAIDAIADTVTNVLGKVANFMSDVVGVITGAKSKSFGK